MQEHGAPHMEETPTLFICANVSRLSRDEEDVWPPSAVFTPDICSLCVCVRYRHAERPFLVRVYVFYSGSLAGSQRRREPIRLGRGLVPPPSCVSFRSGLKFRGNLAIRIHPRKDVPTDTPLHETRQKSPTRRHSDDVGVKLCGVWGGGAVAATSSQRSVLNAACRCDDGFINFADHASGLRRALIQTHADGLFPVYAALEVAPPPCTRLPLR